ncbi:MAG TPA: hypothetical protein PKA15_03635 [Chitinophagales bacterium]|nr:hypothetical protein [Chitinophagales bacterium]HMY41914.1 hypothetical protein [Chitinophagales bacterium]
MYKYKKLKKTKAHQPGWWPEKIKMEAVTLWCSTGSPTTVSETLGIPLCTIETWKTLDWWKNAVEVLRNQDNEKLDSKLTKALDKALDKVLDLIDNGEFIYDQKTGKVKRMPAKLRDVNHAFNSLVDKRQLIRKLPTKIVESSQTEQKLKQLAVQFAEFVNKNKKEPPAITLEQDDEGTYAVHN